MSEQPDGTTATYSELANGIGRAIWMGVIPMIVLLIASVVVAFRGGADRRHLLLAVGALLSAAAIFAYAVLVSTKLKGHVGRGSAPMLLDACGGLFAPRYGFSAHSVCVRLLSL